MAVRDRPRGHLLTGAGGRTRVYRQQRRKPGRTRAGRRQTGVRDSGRPARGVDADTVFFSNPRSPTGRSTSQGRAASPQAARAESTNSRRPREVSARCDERSIAAAVSVSRPAVRDLWVRDRPNPWVSSRPFYSYLRVILSDTRTWTRATEIRRHRLVPGRTDHRTVASLVSDSMTSWTTVVGTGHCRRRRFRGVIYRV